MNAIAPAQPHYGIFPQSESATEADLFSEEISRKGYVVKEQLLDVETCKRLCKWSEEQNSLRNKKYGKEQLAMIGEENLIRLPLQQNEAFFNFFIKHPWLESLLSKLFEKTQSFYRLNQQNIVLNESDSSHGQAAWHRDLPYHAGINSVTNAYSVLITLTDFTLENGATHIVPGSHLHAKLPSWHYINKYQEQVCCPIGSAIIFDSLLLHKAGKNHSGRPRIAVNHLFTLPTFQQQISIPRALRAAENKWHQKLPLSDRRVLGFDTDIFEDEQMLINKKLKNYVKQA